MKTNFRTPEINITFFESENIATTGSGNITAHQAAQETLNSKMEELNIDSLATILEF